jgi:hypothetical protein
MGAKTGLLFRYFRGVSPVTGTLPIFQAHGDLLALFTFHQRAHYIEEGNRLVAEEVLHSISLGN